MNFTLNDVERFFLLETLYSLYNAKDREAGYKFRDAMRWLSNGEFKWSERRTQGAASAENVVELSPTKEQVVWLTAALDQLIPKLGGASILDAVDLHERLVDHNQALAKAGTS